MFVFLRRHGTPAMLALPLSCSILTVVLPVSSAMTAALALQMLLAVTLLLIASPVSPRVITTRRLAALAAITVIGVINHAAFLPFAAVVWLAAVWDARGDAASARRPIPMTGLLMTGLLALVAGLTMTTWLMHLDAAAPLDLAGGRPGIVTLAIGLITGRFAPDLQPAAANPGGLSGLRAALAHLVPGPVIVWFPLAGLAWMRRETRAAATLLASAAAAVWLFSARTWLPDLEVAYAQANVTLALLAGLGLTWLAAQPIRDAKLTAILAAIVIGVNGAFAPERFGVDLHTARLQAFVESVSPSINVGFWTSERLAIDRALLIQRVRGPRVPAQPDVLAALSDDRPLVVFANARARLERDGAWAASFDVPYRSAASLLASLPDGTWLAVARHDDRDDPEADSFFDDLFARLATSRTVAASASASAETPSARHAAALGLIALDGRGDPGDRVGTLDAARLDVTYAQPIGASGRPQAAAPARFTIETEPIVRVVRNGAVSAETPRGAALVAFDPWMGREESWILGGGTAPARAGATDDDLPGGDADRLPVIRDARLLAAWLLHAHAPPRPPRVPVIDAGRVDVRFDRDGAQWFGDGWHGPEGSGDRDRSFRWTNAAAAHVNVLVNRRQAIRVRLDASAASTPGQSNTMSVMWNGEEVEVHPSNNEWTIPEAKVRRGLNVFTIQAEHVDRPRRFRSRRRCAPARRRRARALVRTGAALTASDGSCRTARSARPS